MTPNNSDKLSLLIYMFPCGDGDTIVLGFPCGSWVLVDCHLPKRNGTFHAFEDFLAEIGVQRIDAVFLTHPDQDHLLGMGELLRKFAKAQDGKPTLFVDSGFDAKELVHYYNKQAGRSSYARLLRAVTELQATGDLQHISVDERSIPFMFGSDDACLVMRPIAPAQARARDLLRVQASRLADSSPARPSLNDCSLVLTIRRDMHTGWCVLLTGDSGTASLHDAIDRWIELEGDVHPCRVRFVKIPHHGSETSLSDRLVNLIDKDYEGPCVAAASAGDGFPNPSPVVLKSYMDGGWVTLHTQPRRSHAYVPDRLVELFGVRAGGSVQHIPRDPIRISITLDSGSVSWEPERCRIYEGDLPLYSRVIDAL